LALGDTNHLSGVWSQEAAEVSHAKWLVALGVLTLGCSTHRSLVSAGSPDRPNGAAAVSDLIGTWRLVEFWDRDSAAAPKRYTYGERPMGYFIYDPTGHVSIQIARGPNAYLIARERGEDWFRTAPTEDLRAVVDGFRAYFGTYTVDREAGVVVHQVEGDSRALYTGTPQRRRFRLVGDSLIVGNDTTARRVLIRVR